MKRGLRGVATATLVCFLTTQSVWGAPAAGIEITGGRELPTYLSIDVPVDLGTVDALYEAPASANPQFILHIQNAHANYQAQMKIKQLLQYMNKKYGFSTIFVEGASEKLDPDYLRLFPDQERNLKLCDELAKRGELTGAELYLMEADQNIEALPIEEASLYKANYEALKKVFGAETDVSRFFKGFYAKLDKAASKVFTPETRELIADWKRFEQGRRDFMPFVRELAKKSKKILNVDVTSLFAQVGWPQISRLLVIQQLEKDLNKTKGQEEQAALIQWLRGKNVSSELIATLESFNEGSIAVGKSATEVSPREVLERLNAEAGPQGFKFSDYPAFSLYAGYVVLRSELDPKILFEEIEYLFTQMLDTLARDSRQKSLLALYRDGELLRKLLHLELNRAQWRQAVAGKDRIAAPSLVARLKDAVIAAGDVSVKKDQEVMPKAFSGKMDELYTAGLEFYDYAHKREAVFYKEMQSQMSEKKITKAILITGGFHTDGMSDLFRENAISYGIVTPRLSEKSDENLYQKIMLQNENYPFSVSYMEIVSRLLNINVMIDMGVDVAKLYAGLIDLMMHRSNEGIPATVAQFNQSPLAVKNNIILSFVSKDANNRPTYKIVSRENVTHIPLESVRTGNLQVVSGQIIPTISVATAPSITTVRVTADQGAHDFWRRVESGNSVLLTADGENELLGRVLRGESQEDLTGKLLNPRARNSETPAWDAMISQAVVNGTARSFKGALSAAQETAGFADLKKRSKNDKLQSWDLVAVGESIALVGWLSATGAIGQAPDVVMIDTINTPFNGLSDGWKGKNADAVQWAAKHAGLVADFSRTELVAAMQAAITAAFVEKKSMVESLSAQGAVGQALLSFATAVHEEWMANNKKEGWNDNLFVPFAQLPVQEQLKDINGLIGSLRVARSEARDLDGAPLVRDLLFMTALASYVWPAMIVFLTFIEVAYGRISPAAGQHFLSQAWTLAQITTGAVAVTGVANILLNLIVGRSVSVSRNLVDLIKDLFAPRMRENRKWSPLEVLWHDFWRAEAVMVELKPRIRQSIEILRGANDSERAGLTENINTMIDRLDRVNRWAEWNRALRANTSEEIAAYRQMVDDAMGDDAKKIAMTSARSEARISADVEKFLIDIMENNVDAAAEDAHNGWLAGKQKTLEDNNNPFVGNAAKRVRIRDIVKPDGGIPSREDLEKSLGVTISTEKYGAIQKAVADKNTGLDITHHWFGKSYNEVIGMQADGGVEFASRNAVPLLVLSLYLTDFRGKEIRSFDDLRRILDGLISGQDKSGIDQVSRLNHAGFQALVLGQGERGFRTQVKERVGEAVIKAARTDFKGFDALTKDVQGLDEYTLLPAVNWMLKRLESVKETAPAPFLNRIMSEEVEAAAAEAHNEGWLKGKQAAQTDANNPFIGLGAKRVRVRDVVKPDGTVMSRDEISAKTGAAVPEAKYAAIQSAVKAGNTGADITHPLFRPYVEVLANEADGGVDLASKNALPLMVLALYLTDFRGNDIKTFDDLKGILNGLKSGTDQIGIDQVSRLNHTAFEALVLGQGERGFQTQVKQRAGSAVVKAARTDFAGFDSLNQDVQKLDEYTLLPAAQWMIKRTAAARSEARVEIRPLQTKPEIQGLIDRLVREQRGMALEKPQLLFEIAQDDYGNLGLAIKADRITAEAIPVVAAKFDSKNKILYVLHLMNKVPTITRVDTDSFPANSDGWRWDNSQNNRSLEELEGEAPDAVEAFAPFFRFEVQKGALDVFESKGRPEPRSVVQARQELLDPVLALLSTPALDWYNETKPAFGTAMMADVVWGITVRAEGISAEDAQRVAGTMEAFFLAKRSGKFDLAIFAEKAQPFVAGHPLFAVSETDAKMIEELKEMPSDERLVELVLQLRMNPRQDVVWVMKRGLLDKGAVRARFDAVLQKLDATPDIGRRLDILDSPNVVQAIQTEASKTLATGLVPTILVEDTAMRQDLLRLEGLNGNVLYAETDKNLAAVQRVATIRFSQQSAKLKITPAIWETIAAEYTKKLEGAVKLDPEGRLVLDNTALAALAAVLSDLIAIQATSVSA